MLNKRTQEGHPSSYLERQEICPREKYLEDNTSLLKEISQKISKLIALTTRPQNVDKLKKEESKVILFAGLEIHNWIARVLSRSDKFEKDDKKGDYLDLLKDLLSFFTKDPLPLSYEAIEEAMILEVYNIIDLNDIAEQKLLSAIQASGSFDELFAHDLSERILEKIGIKAEELGKSPEQFSNWIGEFLEVSRNHSGFNREVSARLPLILLIVKWREIQLYLQTNLPQYKNLKISELSEINCAEEPFQSLSFEQKRSFFLLLRSLRAPLKEVGHYMSAFLNTKKCNFVETEKVFALMQKLQEQYPEFKEVEKIVANNNQISILLEHRNTSANAETAQKLSILFQKNIQEILESCESLFDLQSGLESGKLEEKVAYIATEILPKIIKLEEYHEVKDLILPVTKCLHLFFIALHENPHFQAHDLIEKNPNSTTIQKILEEEKNYFEKLFRISILRQNKAELSFRAEFAKSYCDLFAFNFLSSKVGSQNSFEEIRGICRIANIPFPPRILKTIEKLIFIQETITALENQEIITKIQAYLQDEKTPQLEKILYLNNVVDIFSDLLHLVLEEFDERTSIHCENVALSVQAYLLEAQKILEEGEKSDSLCAMGQVLGLSPQKLLQEYKTYFGESLSAETIASYVNGARWHDIGKISIMPHLLLFPGRLEGENRKKIEEHSEKGAKIFEKFPDQIVRESTLSHHEKWDGTGYPKGLKGEAIPKPARIVAFADVWNALTEKRVYQQEEGRNKTAQEMFVRGVFLIINDLLKDKQYFCPFVLKTNFARLGINLETLKNTIQEKTLKQEELIELINWNNNLVKDELKRIQATIDKPDSEKQKIQEEVAEVYNLVVNEMELNSQILKDLFTLWGEGHTKQNILDLVGLSLSSPLIRGMKNAKFDILVFKKIVEVFNSLEEFVTQISFESEDPCETGNELVND